MGGGGVSFSWLDIVLIPCSCGIFMYIFVNTGEYLPSRRRGKFSPIFTEPKANNCFSKIFRRDYQKV